MISLKTDLEWAPIARALSALEFFLWGYLKDRVYAGKPRTITELKEAIREEMRAITIQSVRTSWTTSCCASRNARELNGGPSRTHAVERKKKGQRP